MIRERFVGRSVGTNMKVLNYYFQELVDLIFELKDNLERCTSRSGTLFDYMFTWIFTTVVSWALGIRYGE